MKKSTIAHLRIPFSFLLLPVYLFALCVSPNPDLYSSLLVFFIVHFLLYPASNSFNSYFDKDKQSIGLLKNPPPVTKELYHTANILDVCAVLLGLIIDWKFSLMLVIYSLVSRAYSHPIIRLKKYPITGWFIAGLFQGFFTFLMVWYGINKASFAQLFLYQALIPAALSSLLLWGSYPMTQIYQHEEDSERGDKTLSILLGIKGTFLFTGAVFSLADTAYLLYFIRYFHWHYAIIFQLFLVPVLIYFFVWFMKVLTKKEKADFQHTMRLNWISAIAMNLCFSLIFVLERY